MGNDDFSLDKSVVRELFINNILRDSITVSFRGENLTARKNETSFERKMTLSSFDKTAEFELMIALPIGAPLPVEAKKEDNVSYAGGIYKIIDVKPFKDGTDCYTLTLGKK